MSFVIKDPRQWLHFVPDTLQASSLYAELWEHLKGDSELLELVALISYRSTHPDYLFHRSQLSDIGGTRSPTGTVLSVSTRGSRTATLPGVFIFPRVCARAHGRIAINPA